MRMDDDVRATFEEHRDADCAYEIPGLSRFRVNVFEDRNGIGTVIRTIPVEILTAEQLGLAPSDPGAVFSHERARARHWSNRLGQVDDFGREGQSH